MSTWNDFEVIVPDSLLSLQYYARSKRRQATPRQPQHASSEELVAGRPVMEPFAVFALGRSRRIRIPAAPGARGVHSPRWRVGLVCPAKTPISLCAFSCAFARIWCGTPCANGFWHLEPTCFAFLLV